MTSSIELDFLRDEMEIDELRRADVATVPAAAIELSFLRLPVRFSIGGVSILRALPRNDERWIGTADGLLRVDADDPSQVEHRRPLAVLAFAAALAAGMNEVTQGRVATVSVPEGGVIKLRPDGLMVVVVSEAGGSLIVDGSDLDRAVRGFRRQVDDLLDLEVPSLRISQGSSFNVEGAP